MAVKCLTPSQKEMIAFWYTRKLRNVTELALMSGVSPRTINRVLVEKGLATTVSRIKGEAHIVMKLLEKYGMGYGSLKFLLETRFPTVK